METDVMRRRKMPDLVLEFPSLFEGFLGMIYIVFSILLGLFFLLGGFIGMNSFVTLFGLILTALVIWGTAIAIKEIRNDLVNRKKKRQWIKNAVSVQAVIVDRKEEHNVYAESREEMWDCQLAFRLRDITKDHPEALLIWAAVSDGIFERYRHQDTAQIYFSRDDPNVFVIDGE